MKKLKYLILIVLSSFFPLTDINGFLSFVTNQHCKQSAMFMQVFGDTQRAFTFSKLAIETLEQGVKYVQS